MNRPSKAVVTRVVGIVGALVALSAFLLLSAVLPDSASAQEPGVIMFKENGTGPVRTFISEDPEGAGIDWDVTGIDADDFMISGGVLTFRESPNYEDATDRAHTAEDLNGDNDENDPGEAGVAGDNYYRVTIRATEIRGSGQTGRALSSETNVVVQVENVDEPGVITLNLLEPEADSQIMATLTDPDMGIELAANPDTTEDEGITWQLSTVSNPDEAVDGHWGAITGTAPTPISNPSPYTPGDDDASTATVDRYLRVVAVYTDNEGMEKRAVKKSYMPVRAEVTTLLDEDENPENGSPDFDTETRTNSAYTRTISESAAVDANLGAPVTATDPDSEDTLTYHLDNDTTPNFAVVTDTSPNALPTQDGADVSFFKIDQKSGQITVAKKLDADSVAGRTGTTGTQTEADLTAGEYEVYVTATDPSGERSFVKVDITVTQANDAPKIWKFDDQATGNVPAPGELSVMEQNSDDLDDTPGIDDPYDPADLMDNEYRAADEDAIDQITWSLRGEDMGRFKPTQSNGSVKVEFKEPPDFEAPGDRNGDNVYKVVLRATDNAGAYDERPISITVTNVMETGELGFTETQPLVGEMITAEVSDPDGGVAPITWQWFRIADPNASPLVSVAIEGATSGTYTPTDDDKTMWLMAEATYLDTLSRSDDGSTPGYDERVQTSSTVARTPHNLSADPAEEDTDNHRVYRVSAVTANAVKVAGETTTDPESESPAFSDDAYTREVAENARVGTYVGAPITAVRADATPNPYTLTSSTGDDAFFEIDMHGQITVKDIDAAPDVNQRPDFNYEDKSVYHVSVTATDSDSQTDVAAVTIRLINLNERPYFTELSRGKSAVDFEENRTAAVETYQVMEPDGDSVRWSVKGADAPRFSMSSNGALMFKAPPNYENPNSSVASTETTEARNVYSVTVVATETTAVGNGPKKSAELPVTVTVTNKDEAGTIDFNLLQPEALTPLIGTLTDPDGEATGTDYQWFKSKSGSINRNPSDLTDLSAQWEEISGGTTMSFTPREDDADTPGVEPSDVGRFLLLRAMYNDPESGTEDKYAIGISRYVTRANVTDADNGSPEFAHATVSISVPENTAVDANVGSAVVVDRSSQESGEYLTYTLEAAAASNAGDLAFFKIDKATGQISLREMLSAEQDTRDFTQTPPPVAGEYKVVVRATDPSNETTNNNNTDTILATITATDVNDAPKVTMGAREMTLAEKDSSKEPTDDDYYTALTEDATNAFDASDEDGDLINWRLEGVDRNLFQIGTIAAGETNAGLRQIVFRDAPDFEDPKDQHGDNVYHVTIVAYDTSGATGSRAVRIQVTNVDEAGKLELLPEQPVLEDEQGMVGQIMANLTDYDGIMTDPDGVQTITSWRWYRTDNDVAVTVTVQADGTLEVTPTDAGPLAGENTGVYTIKEGDVGKFLHARVTYRDGASIEDDPVTDVDERDTTIDNTDTLATEPNDNALIGKTKNAVAPMAGDDDEEEDPNMAPTFTPAAVEIMVPENTPSTGYVGSPVVAMDDSEDVLTYELIGPNVNRFALAPADDPDTAGINEAAAYYHESVERDTGPGQIVVKPVTHLDADGTRNSFDLELAATDSEGLRGIAAVTITVTNVNEAPSEPMGFAGGLTVTGPSSNHINENETDLMVATYEAVGQAASSAAFTLGGVDASAFTLGSSDGVLSFIASPDYEMATDMGSDNQYDLVITAAAGGETSPPRAITVNVANVDEDGTVMLLSQTPSVGTEIMATLTDPDGSITGVNWMWQVSADKTTWTEGNGTEMTDAADMTMSTYTPAALDDMMYLRAMAEYTDGAGSDDATSDATTGMVTMEAVPTTGNAVGDRYDLSANGGNDNEEIDIDEVRTAIRDFLFGGNPGGFTLEEVTEYVRLFLFPPTS